MKKNKILTYLLLIFMPLIITLFSPVVVSAEEGINDYYIDLTVQDNGDVLVKELFDLNGEYNGYERIINYRNLHTSDFDGSLDSFNGSSIYNGDDIELIAIKGIEVDDDFNYDDIFNEGDNFQETDYATTGSYGNYIVSSRTNGYTYKIYNPSSTNKAFYIEYVIKNMAVVHNDVAEVGINIFTEEQLEYIKNLEMHIHIPDNQTELRAWGHGPLWGNTENLSKNEVKVTINDLEANTPFDVRFVFDKEVVKNSTKYTSVDGLDKIVEVETEKAEEANRQRQIHKTIKLVVIASNILWYLGLIIILMYTYFKYDKEYKGLFQNDYYRDFPNDYGPEVVGYLMNKKIGSNELSASILNLIYKKVIDFEKLDKKDFKLILNNIPDTLTDGEKKLLNFVFVKSDLQVGDTMLLSQLKKKASSSYSSFLSKYESWKLFAESESKTHNFYENSTAPKVLAILYLFIGGFISTFVINYNPILFIANFFIFISCLIYFISYKKRTKQGNEDYLKWKALKKFMKDFGDLDSKQLPEIALWEKYLVYAVVLGCAKELSKTMELKIKDMNLDDPNMVNTMHDFDRINYITSFNRSLTRSINSSMSNAYSARTAASSSSSSGGFGGGFSGGGGSFGGGGGGGRF